VRAHFNRALLDQQGAPVATAQVRLLVPGGTDPYPQLIYSDATGGTTLTNPWTTTSGEVDFYLDAPDRVKIGITVGTAPEEFWDNVDVTSTGFDSTHPGSGDLSLQIGVGAAATGVHATALGQGAQATGDASTALGEQAVASQVGTVTIGSQADATQPGAAAVGQSALASGSQSAALGAAARATYNHSTAVGAGAQTDRPNQVVLGTAADTVFMPGNTALRSPNGTTFVIAVTNEGLLYAQQVPAYVEPDPVDEGSGDLGDTEEP
jgi:hypothetical protein